MAKESKTARPARLSARFIDTVKTPGVYGDGRGGHGLQLLVEEAVAGGFNKRFVQRLTLHSKRIQMGLGSYPVVTLAEARDAALDNAKLVHAGLDPRAVKKLKNKKVPLFAEAAEIVITERARGWMDGSSTEKTWRSTLRRHALPKIGHMPVDEITHNDIVEMLDPLWYTMRPTANSLFRYTKDIMAWCRRKGYRDDNPVNETVRESAPKNKHRTEHFAFVPYDEVGAALQSIRESRSALATRLAMEFAIFTACRHGSVRKAKWGEIDWDNCLWTIPAEHMKMGRAHRVPLSSGAMAVLKKACELHSGESDLIFPSRNGSGIISQATLSIMCKTLNLPGVPHGFRGSFATWCAEVSVPQELAEATLAHMPDMILQAYTHTDYLRRRVPLMQLWSDYIEGKLPEGWEFTQTTCACGSTTTPQQRAA